LSALSQFTGSSRAIATITNQCSTGTLVPLGTSILNARSISTAAFTANTLQTVLSLTGSGSLNFAAVRAEDGTSRTVRIKILIDGRTVFDATSAATTSLLGLVAVGYVVRTSDGTSAYANALPQFVPFLASCQVQIASSLSEAAGGVLPWVNYEVNA
jgi:hypothetical protein